MIRRDAGHSGVDGRAASDYSPSTRGGLRKLGRRSRFSIR
ncbi:hypothetical protein SAMN05880592_1073 [Bosea sp. TND4EK4]|nr:hypothetical protein SAMN05880592_1073 [Bosea sp. TND4EK4]